MSKDEVYIETIYYQNRLDLVNKMLKVYSIIVELNKPDGKNRKIFRNRLIETLAFYILEGYSKETKQLVEKSLNIKTKNLNQINSELTSLGFLTTDPYNKIKKHLSEDMLKFKETFLDTEKGYMFIEFEKEDV